MVKGMGGAMDLVSSGNRVCVITKKIECDYYSLPDFPVRLYVPVGGCDYGAHC